MTDKTLQHLVAELESDDSLVQMNALRRLSDLGPGARAAVPNLIALRAYSQDVESPVIKDEIGRTLAKLGAPALPEIFRILEDHTEPERSRTEAAATLADLVPVSLPFLLAAMDHEDLAVRLFSVDVLPRTGLHGFEALSRLEKLLQDQSNVGNSAAISMACLAREDNIRPAGSKSAGALLLEGFERGTPLTRRRIVEALCFLGEKSSAFSSIMQRALRDGDEEVRQEAERVLQYLSISESE